MRLLLSRPVVAVAAATALLVLSAHPAAAAPFSVDFYDPAGSDGPGALVLTDEFETMSETLPLEPAGGGPCPATGISVEYPTSTTTRLLSLTFKRTYTRSGTKYQARYQMVGSPTGTYTSGNVSVNNVVFQVTLHTDTNGDCLVNGADALVCTFDFTVDMAGTTNSSPTNTSPGRTLKVSFSPNGTISSAAGCSPPYSNYLGGTVATTGTGGDDIDLVLT